MSLQPFPGRIQSTRLTFGPDGVSKHPEIATTVTQIIAGWSLIDQSTAMIAANCLATARIGVVSAMLSEMRSSDAARAAIVAIVGHALRDSPDGELFTAIMKVTSQERLTRNKLAHWLMGHSEDVPTKLVVADPRIFHEITDFAHQLWIELRKKYAAGEPPVVELDPPRRPKDGIYVLSKNGANIILRETKRCHKLLSGFWKVLLYSEMDRQRADEQRSRLLAEPRIQQALPDPSNSGTP